jgi:outer membrane protein assembly factor BamD (BamD/ComL family)
VFSPEAPVNTLLQQAQRALAVGRVEEAQGELSRVLAQAPGNNAQSQNHYRDLPYRRRHRQGRQHDPA